MTITNIFVTCFVVKQHIAASKGNEECVLVLLTRGCNIEVFKITDQSRKPKKN